MSYDCKWSSEAAIEQELQIEIDDTTRPDSTTVNGWLQQVETGMLKKGYGTQTTPTLTEVDVLPTEAISRGSVAWFLQGLPESEHGRVVIPPHKPIVSTNSGTVSKNTATLTGTPSWTVLKCKDNLSTAADTDFLTMFKYNEKTGTYLGVGWYFYNNIPTAGRRRLRGTWVYGYNIDSQILKDYATLQVSKKVIGARLMAGEPVGLASYRGPDLESFINTQTTALLTYIDGRLAEIEEMYFPKELPIGAIQGI